MNPEILITSAIAKTSYHTAQLLLAQGKKIRVLTRKKSEKVEQLASQGADVAIGDFHDIFSLERSFEGIKKVYFTYPFVPGLLEAASNTAAVAREAGVELLINMSQIISEKGHQSPATRQHWLSENLFDWANIGAVHLYPGLFMDNLLVIAAMTIIQQGKIYLPWADGKHAPLYSGDIGKVIATLLTSPSPNVFVGKKLILTGGQSRTMTEISELIAQIIGRSVAYVNIADKDWVKAIQASDSMLNNSQFLGHAPALSADIRDQKFDVVTSTVQQITGDEPLSLHEFIEQRKALFTSQEALQQAIS